MNHTKVKLWDHAENAKRQRWIMEYGGKSSHSPQTRAEVPTDPVHVRLLRQSSTQRDRTEPHRQIVSDQHENAIDYPGDSVVHGWEFHGGRNQQWIFEPAGSGYAIATHMVDPPAEGRRRYLGLSPNDWSDNSRLVLVSEKDRVIWTVQPAKANTFRCVRQQRDKNNCL